MKFCTGYLCLYVLHKVAIWSGVTDAFSLTTLKYRATQFFIKYTSGALETNLAMLINQMNIMTFGPNYETLSKSGSFGQPETLRLQITILKKSFEESSPGRFLTSKCL